MPNFDIKKFLDGAGSAFDILISELKTQNKIHKNDSGDFENVTASEALQALVDKRYLREFISRSDKYAEINGRKMDVKISDAYTFSMIFFVSVFFCIGDRKEEWVFSKNFRIHSKNWILSNVNDAT